MEPEVERVRRNLGIALLVFVFVGILGGVALLGRIVGDAIGTAYVGKGPSAEGLEYTKQGSGPNQTQLLPGGIEPIPPLTGPDGLPMPVPAPPKKMPAKRS